MSGTLLLHASWYEDLVHLRSGAITRQLTRRIELLTPSARSSNSIGAQYKELVPFSTRIARAIA